LLRAEPREAWQSLFDLKIPLYPPLQKGDRGGLIFNEINETDETDGYLPLMKTSVISEASSSVNCRGGCFMK